MKDLYGKRSQDPYALVYLLAESGATYFQDGNEKTTTFDKTLEPPFKTKFEFKVGFKLILIGPLTSNGRSPWKS